MMSAGDYDLSAVEVAHAIGNVVGDATIRNWVASGRIPSAYVWRSPTGRLYFKRKLVAWLLASGQVAEAPAAPAPKPKVAKVKPVFWDKAS
jgi:hypothetical protein